MPASAPPARPKASQPGALSLLDGVLRAATTFAIVCTDPDGNVTLFSEAARRMFGVASPEAAPRTPLALLDPREVRALGARLGAARGRSIEGFAALVAECDGDAPVEHGFTMRRADATTFHGVLVAARALDDDGTLAAYAFIARDNTEQRAVERMKDEFVSMVSHELRTPLTAIRGAIGLAAGGVAGPVPEGLSELLHIAHLNTERLLHIVNDILDIHRLQSGVLDLDLSPTNVLAIVQRAVEVSGPLGAEYGVSFYLSERAADATVMADFERMVQVISNLVSNAVKYSPTCGRVEIDVAVQRRSAHITIADRGPGISDEFRGRIFQKFAQAATGNMRHGGTGLGLSIVKSLVDLHGGQVGFDSVPGQGTTFFVDLPVLDAV